jgi:DNA invertase Pin-like site-specific DNA recombinase
LQQLIKDVECGAADFQIILVYDVSRWGRFQDADESAYYEYICRRAGIQVAYCAEQFENDGSPVSTIVKGVKRAMAGEYSRELSAKVFAGQCRLIELGYRQGGPAGYGLRRVLIDQTGSIKGELSRGEHKSLQTDRVILMPGPDTEVQTVNQIYHWFIDEGLPESEIAHRLNNSGTRTDLDRDWTRATVREVLSNEKYIGNNIYNRISFKLKKLRVINQPDMWIKKEGAFEAIVPPEVFYTAQGIMRARVHRYSNEELIEKLRKLYQCKGFLSGLIIDETEGMPSAAAYIHRFGSLIRAYQAVGFTPDRDYRYLEVNQLLRRMHPEIVGRTEQMIGELGGSVERDPATDMLMLNREFSVSVVLSRCQVLDTGHRRWKVRFDTSLAPDITVAVRLDEANQAPQDYYLLPRLDFGLPRVNLADHNGIEFESYRFDNLDYLYGMAERTRIRRAA